MLTYSQTTGELRNGDTLMGKGWAGNDSRPGVNPDCIQGKNNPEAQTVHCIGPLPQGMYAIHYPVDHSDLGPLAFPLAPYPTNEMFGRSGFFVHGASVDPEKTQNSSEGCIIMPHSVREELVHFVGTPIQVVE